MSGTEQQHIVAEPRRRRSARGADTIAVPAEREHVIAMLCDLVEPLGQALPLATEVVLHDLSRLPDSIVAVHGNVTGRLKAEQQARELEERYRALLESQKDPNSRKSS